MPPRRRQTPPQAPVPPPPPQVDPATFMQAMFNFFKSRQGQQVPQPVQPEGGQMHHAHREFRSYNPPKFVGGDDVKAEHWLAEIEEIFEVCQCTPQEMARFAAFLLQGPAKNWWNGVKLNLQATGEELVWDVFVREFKEKYIPQVVRNRRER